MVKKLSTLMLASMLTACVAGDPGSSSSDAQSSSSTASASSQPAISKTGKELFEENKCNLCHGDNADVDNDAKIHFENYSVESMARAIDATMPKEAFGVSPTSCTIDNGCAEKVAEYVMSLAPSIACGDSVDILPRRIRMLTTREYGNTINDLLDRNDGASFSELLGRDTLVKGFDNNVARGSSPTIPRIDAYWTAAEQIIESQPNLESFLNCGQQQQNPNPDDVRRCADSFIPRFGKRAFRRDLSTDEINAYKALFNQGATRAEGFAIAAQAFLTSPHFLYRTELGSLDDNGQTQLTNYEIASLLSYTYWGTMPDDTLLNNANQLSDSNTLRLQAERLLQDNRAKEQFAHFARQWLGVQDLATVQRSEDDFPNFNSDLAVAMGHEFDEFMKEILLGDGYSASDIFTADFTYLNRALAEFYGLSTQNLNDNQFVKTTVSDVRSGVLSKGAILTLNASFASTHPIRRGLLIREQVLCQEFGSPPPAVGDIGGLDKSLPIRERLFEHTVNPACSFCHENIDPLGFAFENYDATGGYRTIDPDSNANVDASGAIVGLASMADLDSHDFNDLSGLAGILANQGKDEISSCVAEQFYRYYQGVATPDHCNIAKDTETWLAGAASLKDLWLTPVTSSQFKVRQ